MVACIVPNDPTPLPCDLREAEQFLPTGTAEEWEAFACRQLRSRGRLTQLLQFYRAYPCRMSRTLILAASAITLGRFCGLSQSFDAIGEAMMPMDASGVFHSAEWRRYTEACAAGRPWDVRDELWLAGYMGALNRVCGAGLDVAFYAEVEGHPSEPTWRLLRQHMEVTIGARLIDNAAIGGVVAYETAMSRTMSLALRRLFTTGWKLLAFYAGKAAHAILFPAREPERPVIGYRQCATQMIRCAATAWAAGRIYRRGVRQRDRGSLAAEEGWPMLQSVLGEKISEVHPLTVQFYSNPAPFRVKATLALHTAPARMWSRLATLLVGQGLYETDQKDIEASFRVFRRADGSMHFIRELYCGGALRVFDSDFVVRPVDGRSSLFEVFVDLGVEVEMDLQPLPGGGLCIRSRNIYLRGVRLPPVGLQVEFRSFVEEDGAAGSQVRIEGRLLMEPQSSVGRFVMWRVLGRPHELGSICYRATPP